MLVEMKTEMNFPKELIPNRLAVGRAQIDAYAEMSNDFNPIHMDAEAARSAGMTDAIAHGMLSLNLIWESIETSFDILHSHELSLDVRFRSPVHLDETVETGSALKTETGDYEVWVSNQNGLRVIEGTLKVRAKGHTDD